MKNQIRNYIRQQIRSLLEGVEIVRTLVPYHNTPEEAIESAKSEVGKLDYKVSPADANPIITTNGKTFELNDYKQLKSLESFMVRFPVTNVKSSEERTLCIDISVEPGEVTRYESTAYIK